MAANGFTGSVKPSKHKLKRDPQNACHRFKSLGKNHVWSYDFVADRTDQGRRIRFLNVVDEFTRECLTIEARRSYTGKDVVNTLAELFVIRGRPCYIRSYNGPEFIGDDVKKWLVANFVGTIFVEPASPWQNGYIESFNGKFRNECLNGELFTSRLEAQYVADRWRLDYNHNRPHMLLPGHITPAMYAKNCRDFSRKWLGFVPEDVKIQNAVKIPI